MPMWSVNVSAQVADTSSKHRPKCGFLWLGWHAQWLIQCTQYWQYGHSFGYQNGLVAGYKHIFWGWLAKDGNMNVKFKFCKTNS